jgi:hypothetical protein
LIKDLFDRNEANDLRDKGIHRAVTNADKTHEDWAARAYAALEGFVNETADLEFMAEDVRKWASYLPVPPSNRAWGAVILRGARNGLIKQVGYGKTTNKLAHRTPAAIWRAA